MIKVGSLGNYPKGGGEIMRIERGEMFWKQVVDLAPALDAFWIKDWIIDLNETMVDDPETAGTVIIDSVEFEDEKDNVWFEGTWLWLDGSEHRVHGIIGHDDFVFWEVEE